jgi:SAM-dependent methyltransferase
MNALENWFCSTAFWRLLTERRLLPCLLADAKLGEHVLELGSGPGATTAELRRRAERVTSLEYSHAFAARLAARERGTNASVVQGDAAALPFADGTFSSVVAILMLHHLRTSEAQDRAFAEARRVLRPGGNFFAFEIPDGWLPRVIHRKSVFVPVPSASVTARLTAAGFSNVNVHAQRGGFRFVAMRSVDRAAAAT